MFRGLTKLLMSNPPQSPPASIGVNFYDFFFSPGLPPFFPLENATFHLGFDHYVITHPLGATYRLKIGAAIGIGATKFWLQCRKVLVPDYILVLCCTFCFDRYNVVKLMNPCSVDTVQLLTPSIDCEDFDSIDCLNSIMQVLD